MISRAPPSPTHIGQSCFLEYLFLCLNGCDAVSPHGQLCPELSGRCVFTDSPELTVTSVFRVSF